MPGKRKLRVFFTAGDEFGRAVALEGDRAVVSTIRENDHEGAAYVFERQNDGQWREVDKLKGRGNFFGRSIALEGDRILAGAENAAYVFERQSDGTWAQAFAFPKKGTYNFGRSVSMKGRLALISVSNEAVRGRRYDNADVGVAYLFQLQDDGTWKIVDKFAATPGDLLTDPNYHIALLANDYVLMSVSGVTEGTGTVYVFEGSETLASDAGNHQKQQDKNEEARFAPKEMATLDLRVTPQDAEVYIDGEAPTKRVLRLRPGSYSLRVAKPCYTTHEETLTLVSGETTVRSITLETASLQLTVEPPDAAVYINGLRKGWQSVEQIVPGEYTITVSKEGYYPQAETLRITPGSSLERTYMLQPKFRHLQIAVQPPSAQVTLRWRGKIVETWEGARLFENLLEGSYALETHLEGYKLRRDSIFVKEHETLQIELELVKIPKFNNSLGMEFIFIEPGETTIVDTRLDINTLEKNSTSRTIQVEEGFYLSKYEVTQQQFKTFVDATGYVTEAEKRGKCWEYTTRGGARPMQTPNGRNWQNAFVGDLHPVVCVTGMDAMAFVTWLNKNEGQRVYRLPTSEEWEYATRAGSKAIPIFDGDNHVLDDYVWYNKTVDKGPKPVGLKRPNLWGLYDMLGNVAEWVQGSRDGRQYPLRGGSWSDGPPVFNNSLAYGRSTAQAADNIGFRVVRSEAR